jgi:hypothetical protein
MAEKKIEIGNTEPQARKTMPLAVRPSQFMDTAYKVSLFVDIFGQKKINNATHYQIRVTKNEGAENIVFRDIYRRYNAFHE